MRRLALVVAAAAALLTGAAAWAVRIGWTDALDSAGLHLFRSESTGGPVGPGWLQEAGRDVTALGSNGVLGILVALLAVRAARLRRTREAVLPPAAFAGGLLLVGVVKSLVHRARPDVVEPAVRVFTTSFPSSHAAISAALLAVSALLAPRSDRWIAAAAASLVAAAVGVSRVYLGVHWASDVIAGWLLGICVAALCWAAWPK